MAKKTQAEKDSELLAQSTVDNPAPNQLTANAGIDAVHAKQYTSDDVDSHVQNFAATIAGAAQPSLETPPLAAIYTAARPILLLLEGILFFKPTWRTALKVLVAGLDAEFPTATQY